MHLNVCMLYKISIFYDLIHLNVLDFYRKNYSLCLNRIYKLWKKINIKSGWKEIEI